MNLRHLTLIFLTGIMLASCSAEYDKLLNSPVVQDKYNGAFKYYNLKKYTKSSELFESILMAERGTAQEDSVQFYLGMSNYNLGDYITAEANFDQFAQTFPLSPFTEKAKYLRIKCLYDQTYRYELDQTPTLKALAAMNEFTYDYPESQYLKECKDMMKDLQGRLDEKSYEAAKLYYKIEDYRSAVYALKNALKDNPDNSYREDIMYYIVASAYKFASNSVQQKQKERYMSLIDEYYNFVSEFPDSKYRAEVDQMFKKAQEVTNIKK